MSKELKNKNSEEELTYMNLIGSAEERTEDLRGWHQEGYGILIRTKSRTQVQDSDAVFIIDVKGWASLLENMEAHFWEHYFNIYAKRSWCNSVI